MQDNVNELPSGFADSKDCLTCGLNKELIHFKRDASYRDSHRDMCWECENAPKLSTLEHVHRLRERNENSEGVKRQRWVDPNDYRNETSRMGHRLYHAQFLGRLFKIAKNLYVTEGRVENCLALYQVGGVKRPDWNNQTFRYLMYVPTGWLYEYSTIEFGDYDIPIREKERGWRTILLRLIKSGIVSAKDVDEEFGEASGPASINYRKQVWQYLNRQ